MVSMAAICYLSLGELKAGQSLQEPHGVDLVRRRIAGGVTMETGRPGPRGALQPAKGSCWELEENHVTVMRQQGPLAFGEFVMPPSP